MWAVDENHVVGLIQFTPESEDTSEAEITEKGVVDTMGNDMLKAMEHKNCQIYDESNYICGQEHEKDDEIFLCLMPLNKILDIKDTCGFLRQLMAQNIL